MAHTDVSASPAPDPARVRDAAYFDAWSRDAQALYGQQHYAQAMARYEAMLSLWPQHPAIWLNRGNALFFLGEPEAALSSYDRALELAPALAEAWSCRGNVLRALQRREAAIDSLERAVSLRPGFAAAWANLGNALRDAGRREAALTCYDRALALAPDHPGTLANRGNVLRELQRLDAALADFERAVTLAPASAMVLSNRANVLFDLGRPDAALAGYDAALALAPDDAMIWCNRAGALRALQRHAQSLDDIGRALQLRPGERVILANRGDTLCAMGRYDEALRDYDAALAAAPGTPDSPDEVPANRPARAQLYSNRGNALRALRHYEAALDSYAQALALLDAGTQALVRLNAALCRLAMGDFVRGWAQYEWRLNTPEGLRHARHTDAPRWHGGIAPAGLRILLHAEQGYGDTLQFCRYARVLAERGAHVILEVQPALKSLLGQLAGVAQLLAQGEPLPAFDYQCPLPSLALACATTPSTVPPPAPLRADPQRVARHLARLVAQAAPRGGAAAAGAARVPRIGLAWSGNPRHLDDRQRSLPLHALLPLCALPLHYVSLHNTLRAPAELAWLEAHAIGYCGAHLHDFADTAALLACMDLVITVDTAVAHLAAAMGKPVWVLLPYSPDWRWAGAQEACLWYPQARLFRQNAPGDWGSVLGQVVRQLQGSNPMEYT